MESETFIRLFRDLTGETPEKLYPLNRGGSDRNYYRLHYRDISVIGCVNDDLSENEAFFHISEVFKQNGINVPEVLAVSSDRLYYLMSDLGDRDLYSMVTKRETDELPGDLLEMYKKSLAMLVKVQSIGIDQFNQNLFYPVRSFNQVSIDWDLNYFKYYFLKPSGISFNERKLHADFETLTNLVLNDRRSFFMYRDFQSRNIMIKDGQPWFIDYQGGRKGSLGYDVASLLFQAKAKLTKEDRQLLLDFYKDELVSHIDYTDNNFDHYFYPIALLRTLQVLGAYGFRGVYQRKAHFLSSILPALNNLSEILDHLKALHRVLELGRCLRALLADADKYKVNKSTKFRLVVSSFSYINGGVPSDYTGHGGGYAFDCRLLPNPGREEQYKQLTGMDTTVQEYLQKHDEVADYIDDTLVLVKKHIDRYLERGFSYLSVSYGCTGGQHRSVYCAEQAAAKLKRLYPDLEIQVNHVAQHKTYLCP
ncbi:MAG: phosphotransferase [Salinivirgaceae bacterium]|jgi:aminoglycoside/choline kinase family phosphotransferase|nr:phosphotransferase [Salinivirgaceae bacterium]